MWSHCGDVVRSRVWSRYVALRCGLMAASPCSADLLRILALIFVLITSWLFIYGYYGYFSFNKRTIGLPRWLGECSSLLGQGRERGRAKGQGSTPPSIPG